MLRRGALRKALGSATLSFSKPGRTAGASQRATLLLVCTSLGLDDGFKVFPATRDRFRAITRFSPVLFIFSLQWGYLPHGACWNRCAGAREPGKEIVGGAPGMRALY